MSWSLRIRVLPWPIVVCTVLLAAIGLAAVDRGDQLAGGGGLSHGLAASGGTASGGVWNGTTASGGLWHRQVVWLVLAAVGMAAAAAVPYRKLQPLGFPLLLACLLLLGAVYLLPARNGAYRWIPLGAFDFQPSELTKLAFILALSNYLIHRRNYRKLWGLLVPFAIALVPVGLILREPDLGTSLIFLPVLFAMLFAAGARRRHLLLVVMLGVAVTPLMWMGMSAEQKSRVVDLMVQRDRGAAPAGDGYHLHQSKQVLALGGFGGSQFSGPLLDDPLAYHLPAARTDFIFCLVGERFGLVGAAATLCLYLLLFASGLRIAAATREPFGRLLAVGVIALLATQTIINTAMTVGLMPVTGITLPLLSHGGSSLLTTAISLGMLLSVGMRRGYEICPAPFVFAAPD